jgi:hypothetical protein
MPIALKRAGIDVAPDTVERLSAGRPTVQARILRVRVDSVLPIASSAAAMTTSIPRLRAECRNRNLAQNAVRRLGRRSGLLSFG